MSQPVPEPIKRSPEFDGPPQKLHGLRDMEPTRMGDVTSFHRGLHVNMRLPNRPDCYGRITGVEHDDLVSEIRVRWNGEYDKRRGDPEQVIRIEMTP